MARPARSFISVEMADTLLVSAPTMIGVIRPAGIDTATEMSARLYLNNWSPAKLTLHSGTSISAWASALIMQIVDAELDVAAFEALVELGAQLEQAHRG